MSSLPFVSHPRRKEKRQRNRYDHIYLAAAAAASLARLGDNTASDVDNT